MSRFPNSRKQTFLEEIPKASIDFEGDLLTGKCKFNFSYYDVQAAGQGFSDWDHERLCKLLNKFVEYSKESLLHWRNAPIGRKSGNVLSVYGAFPKNSDFKHPKHVPHEVEWGRFRLDYSVRLVGFVVPNKYNDIEHLKTKRRFDCNTFYVVFLDANHNFYKGGEAS